MVHLRAGNCWLPPSNRDHKFTNGWLNAFIKGSAFFLGSTSFSCSQELLEVSFFENNCNAKPLHWTPESLSFFLVHCIVTFCNLVVGILFLSFSCPSLPCSWFFSHELFAFFWYGFLAALLQTFLFSKLHFQLFFFFSSRIPGKKNFYLSPLRNSPSNTLTPKSRWETGGSNDVELIVLQTSMSEYPFLPLLW